MMTELEELRRRVTLLETEAEGERRVSRHILRKVTENENLLLEVKKEVTEIRNELTLLRADLPSMMATVVGALLREMKESLR